MSVSSLSAEVSRLRSQLNQIQRENSQMRSEINSVVNSVNQAERELSSYNDHIRNTLDRSSQIIDQSNRKSLDAYELQGQIDQLYVRYKQVELANKKIRELNNKKFYDFNNYRTVRKIIRGMMDNLDLSMVSDDVIYKSIEHQHLLTPDYWLTSALISVMAWKNDDKELADRALEVSYKLDPKNCCIFYMIFNLRMDRTDAAVKWFLEYQKHELKGSDEKTCLMLFSLISSTLNDNLDAETAGLINDYIHRLINECVEKEGYSEAKIVAMIHNIFKGLNQAETYELPLLSQYLGDCGDIVRMLNLAKNNYRILELILKIINVPVSEKNTFLKDFLNDLMERPNAVEIGTYEEMEYNELIIRLQGDVETAKKSWAEHMERKEAELNIINAMVEWMYDFSDEHINGQMRLNMFTLLKHLQEQGAESYVKEYRSMYRDIHPMKIQEYTTDADFRNLAGELTKAENYYAGIQVQQLSEVKDLMAYVSFGAGIACAAAGILLNPFFFAGLGIGAALGAGIMLSNRFKRKNIKLTVQKRKEAVQAIIRKIFGEYETMKGIYKEYDQVSNNIMEELAKI